MIDWIRYASVLCNALVVEVNLTILCYCNVLKKGVTLDGTIDVWLVLLREVDNLSVAATFEVKHAIVVPSVLVVTNKAALWIC